MKLKLLFMAAATALLAGCIQPPRPAISNANQEPLLSESETNEILADAWNLFVKTPPTYYSSKKNDAARVLFVRARLDGPPLAAEQLAAMDDMHLCIAYSEWRNNKLADHEIERRKLIRSDNLIAVAEQEVNVGMTRYEVVASRGFPDHINTTKTANGSTEQWCYDAVEPAWFVYFDEKGIVEAVQQ
jgi:hypothetical protein